MSDVRVNEETPIYSPNESPNESPKRDLSEYEDTISNAIRRMESDLEALKRARLILLTEVPRLYPGASLPPVHFDTQEDVEDDNTVTPLASVKTKFCPSCSTRYKLSANPPPFGKNAAMADGLQRHCRDCMNQARKKTAKKAKRK